MSFISIQNYSSSFGELIIGVYDNQLVLADWKYRKMRSTIDRRIAKSLNSEFQQLSHPLIEKTIFQLKEYEQGKRKQFDLPIKLIGSDFQKKVWTHLLKIPFGHTDTYLGLSQKIGNEKAIRAVASANGANAISIVVPCHRIIGSQGELTGYAGGLAVKKKLLELERPNLQTQLF